MANETFDASTVMEGVKARIRATFVDLIPAEHWDSMIEKEIEYFLKPGPTRYQNFTTPSSFCSIIQNELEKDLKARLKTMLDSPEWQTKWDENGKMLASETIQKLLVEKSPEIINKTLASMFQQYLSGFRP